MKTVQITSPCGPLPSTLYSIKLCNTWQYSFRNCKHLSQQKSTNFPKNMKPPQNSKRQKRHMQQVPY